MAISVADLEEIDVIGAYDQLYAALDVGVGISWAEWICKNTYLNSEPFSFTGYEYLIEPVNDTFPRQAIKKPAQVGASEIFQRKMFAILHRYATVPHYYSENGLERCIWGINSIYSFPDTDNLRRFVKDRVKTNFINQSPVLLKGLKESESEALDQLGIYNSFCYFTGRRTYSGNQSVPTEVVFIDEYDLPLNSDRKAIGALAGRVQNARVFGNENLTGLIVSYGTPTFPDESDEPVLIDGLFNKSDQRFWTIKCSRCGYWQVVEYPDSIANYYEKGSKKPKKDPYYMCLRCHKPLDFRVIGLWNPAEPNKYQNAEWVAKYPNRTKDGTGIRGYQVPFATLRNTAKKLITRRDQDYKSVADFHNYGLGRAYMDNTIGLDDETFIRSVNQDVSWGVFDPDYSHVMGMDQGCYMAIARMKENSQTEINPQGIWTLVWCGHILDLIAFSRVIKEGNDLKIEKGKIAELIESWGIDVAVFDRLPNVASAEAEANLFPEIIWLNNSKGNFPDRLRIEKEDEEGNQIHRLTENKHLMIDQYFQDIRSRRFEYAGNGGHDFDQFKAHHKNVKKITDDKGGFQYQAFGPDHYAQAGKYLSQAIELFTIYKPYKRRSGVLAILGFQTKGR
jgi:hypothetical protein